MQPVPSPEHDHFNWLLSRKLIPQDVGVEFLRKVQAQKPLDLPDLMAGKTLPTLFHLLEQAGHITAAQREEGLKECAEQRAAFLNWRSQTMAEEQRKRQMLPPGGPSVPHG